MTIGCCPERLLSWVLGSLASGLGGLEVAACWMNTVKVTDKAAP